MGQSVLTGKMEPTTEMKGQDQVQSIRGQVQKGEKQGRQMAVG